MHTSVILTLLLLSSALCAPTLMATPAVSQAHELASLIDKALQANASLKALEAEHTAALARIDATSSLDNPMLGVEAMNVPSDSWRFDREEMTGVQISLAQKLPFPGKRSQLRELAQLRSQTVEQRIRQLRLEINWDIKRIYYDLYLKSQRKSIIENQRIYLQQTLVTSRSRYTLGQVSQASILNLQVEEARLLNEQLRLSSEMKNLEAELAHVGGHSEHAIALAFEPLHIDRLDLKRMSEDTLTQKVLAQNAELQALQSEVKVGEASVELARKDRLPDFEVMASYTVREPISGMGAKSSGQDLASAKIALSLPLWGRQSAQIKEAVATKERASYELENARLMQIHQARALFAELKESVQRIELFENGLLQLSRQAVAAGKSGYLTGKIEYTTLLDALNRLQETEYSYQEALVSYQVQMAKLEALLGQALGTT